jgi:tetratricopeptide (TPR) repeat protein
MAQVLLFEQAQKLLLQCLAENPNIAVAHANLGLVLWKTGESTGAIKSFNRALELDPAHVDARINLGSVSLMSGDKSAAMECFKTALVIDPDNPAVHLGLGQVWLDTGELAPAIASIKHALVLDPYCHGSDPALFACAFTRYGKSVYDSQDYDEAISAFKGALGLNPACAYSWNGLALALTAQASMSMGCDFTTPESISASKQAVELDPRNVQFLSTLGTQLSQSGDASSAIKLLKLALDMDPAYSQTPRSLILLGTSQGMLGFISDQIGSYEKALAMGSEFSNALCDEYKVGIMLSIARELQSRLEHMEVSCREIPVCEIETEGDLKKNQGIRSLMKKMNHIEAANSMRQQLSKWHITFVHSPVELSVKDHQAIRAVYDAAQAQQEHEHEQRQRWAAEMKQAAMDKGRSGLGALSLSTSE